MQPEHFLGLEGRSWLRDRSALRWSSRLSSGRARSRQVLVQTGVPTVLRFVPGATFAIAVIVTNKSAAPITLERSQAVLSHRSPMRQIGTRLSAYKPFVCPPGAMCPYIDPIGQPPYGTAERPVPLTVAPGDKTLAQLHFRFNACTPQVGGSVPTTKRVIVMYRTPDGSIVHQRLPLATRHRSWRI